MSHASILLCALILDALIGEPRWLWSRVPHPAVLMGNLIGWTDHRFNTGRLRRAKGVCVMLALCAIAYGLGHLLSQFGFVIEVIFAAILIAQKSLVEHVSAVATQLRQSIELGRKSVAMIVGRDTATMDGPAIARSAIESAAENQSDGVFAPAFWFLIGGLPALLIYKITNTADSMIGYRTPRFAEFGWAAARLDDLLNWVPARLTALLIALPAQGLSQWPAIRRDAALHKSPNAGWPEAAMAGVLDVALSGPRIYDGQRTDDVFVNSKGKKVLASTDILDATRALNRSWFVLAGFFALVTAIVFLL